MSHKTNFCVLGGSWFHYHRNWPVSSDYLPLIYALSNRAMTKGGLWKWQNVAESVDSKVQVTFLLFYLRLHNLSDACQHFVRAIKDPQERWPEDSCQHLAFNSCQQLVKHEPESHWKWVHPLVPVKTSNDSNPGQNLDCNVLTSQILKCFIQCRNLPCL